MPNVTVNPDGSYTLNQYALFPDQTIEYKVKNVFIAGVQLQQPLYMGGKVGSAYRMSRIGQQIAADNITLTRAQVILRTDEAYVMAVRASQLAIVARQYKGVLEELKKNIDSAVRHGLKTRNDQMKVQVKLHTYPITNGTLSVSELCKCTANTLTKVIVETVMSSLNTKVIKH